MSDLWVIPEELGDLSTSDYAYEACKTASYLMWAMSGRRFNSEGTVTERYMKNRRHDDMSFEDWIARTDAGYTDNFITANRPVVPSSVLRLKRANVRSVVSVKQHDGTIVDPSTYTLFNGSSIQFNGPIFHTIDVTYTYGTPIPTAGRMAARQLAIEFAKLWEGDDSCSLPERVTSITRQGITATIMDNQQFIQQLRTGVYAVDLFLKTVNPNSATNRARVFSPDIRTGRRVRGEVTKKTNGSPWIIVPRPGE